MSKTIPASKMSKSDQDAWVRLVDDVAKMWHLCSYLPFVADGELHGVFVGQKRDPNDAFAVAEDRRYYVFRAYSTTTEIEHHGRFAEDDRTKAVASRFAAAEGHAEIVYDNSREANPR